MLKKIFPYFLFITIISCSPSKEIEKMYNENVGDIAYNPKIDNPNFIIGSNKIIQYYNYGKVVNYKGEKIAIDNYFKSNYKSQKIISETGYITIKFIVNVKGETGWFRIEEMDMNCKPKKFKKSISNQLLELTKKLDGWIVGEIDGNKYAYYQYLTFKIKDGLILEVLQ